MSAEGWLVFAAFWVVFVTSPGPNAVNCIQTGMAAGLPRALWSVAGILTQAALFLTLSAIGITALLIHSPTGFFIAKLIGAGFLIWTGLRNWRAAAQPLGMGHGGAASRQAIYARAFLVATINPKSVAGYLAAFSQFVQPNVPIAAQMWAIVPTALTITAASYTSYTTLGALLGRAALGAVANRNIRRGLALCLMGYGIALGASAL